MGLVLGDFLLRFRACGKDFRLGKAIFTVVGS